MADPAWRAAHTSVSKDFIGGYYKNSRLHHLSTWKAELKELVAQAQERAEKGTTMGHEIGMEEGEGEGASLGASSTRRTLDKGKGWESGVSMKDAELVLKNPLKGKAKAKGRTIETEETVIMHCDFDAFFVSAGLVDRPELKGKPVAVCHSQGGQGGQGSTSEIASASYEARKFGIKNGMRLVVSFFLTVVFLLTSHVLKVYNKLGSFAQTYRLFRTSLKSTLHVSGLASRQDVKLTLASCLGTKNYPSSSTPFL